MQRLARLIQSSTAVRRQIWASLPFGIRLGQFCVRLATSSTDAFGKMVYGEFLVHGITGMPEIHGRPAEEFDVSRKPVANRLPPGYGKAFGKSAFLILTSKFRNPQLAEEVLSSFALRFLSSGSAHLQAGMTLKEAERYVIRGLVNEAINAKNKKREVSDVIFSEDGDEERRELQVFDDDSAERQLDRMLPKVRSRLRAIHPDAEQYLRLSIVEGYTDREIIGDPDHGVPSMLAHPFTSTGKPILERNFNTAIKPKIYNVLKDYFGRDPHAHL